MEGLMTYGSDDDSAHDAPKQKPPGQNNVNQADDQLQAEWDSFEKMLGGSAFSEQPASGPVGVPPLVDPVKPPPDVPDTGGTNDTDDVHMSDDEKKSSSSSDSSSSDSDDSDDQEGDSNSDSSDSSKKASGDDSSDGDSSDSESENNSRAASKEKSASPEATGKAAEAEAAPVAAPVEPKEITTDEQRKSVEGQRKSTERRPSHEQRSGSKSRERRASSGSRERRRSRPSPSRSARHRRSSKDRHRHRGRPGHSRKRPHRSRSRSPHRRRSHSRERRRHRSPGHRRRRSGGRGRRDGHRKDHRRSNSHSRHRKRSRSRSHGRNVPRRRSERSMSPIVPPVKKKENKPMNFKEQLKASLMNVQKQAKEGTLDLAKLEAEAADLKPGEKPSNLPLNNPNPLLAMAKGDKVTPQVALMQTMAAMHQKAQELTGVAVPKYYNPAAVNPLKYAEQMQKRKLLWSKAKDNKEEEKTWGSLKFQDNDGKQTDKFRKLMGIKHENAPGPSEGEDPCKAAEQLQKQEELFSRLDKEYEFARMTTHTQRGVGLGFSSHGIPLHIAQQMHAQQQQQQQQQQASQAQPPK